MTIEFQGGEPTANWAVLRHIVEYARKKNETAQEGLSFALVTNLSLMDDEKLDFLLDSTSRSAPASTAPRPAQQDPHLHAAATATRRCLLDEEDQPALRRTWGSTPTSTASRRCRRSRGRACRAGRTSSTVRRGSAAAPIFLRKLDPFGFAAKSAKTLGYSMDEFLEFYANAVDYIIELNRQGVQVMERHAAIMLNKILADEEPNYLDLRIPAAPASASSATRPTAASTHRRGPLRRLDGRRDVQDRHRRTTATRD
jgi:hypothetical protein